MATQQVDAKTGAAKKYYTRFTLAQRIEHIVLLASFTLLALTGLPQKFVPNPIAESAIALMGGIETVRILHRIGAVAIVNALLILPTVRVVRWASAPTRQAGGLQTR
jgi:cytochrome b subunit of formate dehydrogenase